MRDTVSHAAQHDLPLRVKFIGCAPLEISSGVVWKIVLHSSVISYVCMLGIALAAAGTVIALQDPTASKIHLPLLLFVKPLLVVLIATSIGVLYIEFTKRYPKYSIFFDGEKLSVHWFIPIAIALYIVNTGNIIIRDVIEHTEHSILRYTLAPVLYTAIAEAFSVFAVTHLPAIRSYIEGHFHRAHPAPPQPTHGDPRPGMPNRSQAMPGDAPLPALNPYHPVHQRGGQSGVGEPASDTPPTLPQAPRKLARIGSRTVDLAGPVLLSARGNYVEVIDPKGTELVRGPLASLLSDIDDEAGIQIHRSSWVSYAGCAAVEKEGTDLVLVTSLGVKAKIARPRHREVCAELEKRNVLS